MVNLRSNPKANDIVTIRGRTAWFEEPLHARFKRVPVPQRRERREGTQEDSLTYITLTFDQPPRDVRVYPKVLRILRSGSKNVLTFNQGYSMVLHWSGPK